MFSIGLTSRQKRRKLQTHLAATAGLYDDDLYVESNSNYLGNVLQNANVVPESDFSDHLNNDVHSAEPEKNSEIYYSDLDPLSESEDKLDVEDKLEVPDIFSDCEFQDDSEVFFYCEEEPSLDCDYYFSKRLASWAVQCKIPQCHVDKLLTLLKSSYGSDITSLPSRYMSDIIENHSALKTIGKG